MSGTIQGALLVRLASCNELLLVVVNRVNINSAVIHKTVSNLKYS